MLRPQGQLRILTPDAPVYERDSFTCHHCQRVVFVEPRCDPATAGGFCRRCMALVCPTCASVGGCTPWEKAMELAEKQAESRRRLDAALTGA